VSEVESLLGETSEPVVPVATSSVLARARPRALVGMWAWESVLAVLAAWPASALVRSSYGRHPLGDAPLWDAGALPLLGLLSRETNGVREATGTAAAVLVLSVLAGLVPLAALMIAIASAMPDGRGIGAARAIAAALRAFRPFSRLLVFVGILQGLVAGAAVLFGEGVQGWAQRPLGEARAQELAIGIGGAVFLGAVALGVVHDLARAAVVRLELRAIRSFSVGWRALRWAPLAVGWSWSWRAVVSAVPVVAVGLVADRLGGRGGMALVVLAVLHQTVVITRVALRASWLAKAMRTIDHFAASER
jgi:hypothetical protein